MVHLKIVRRLRQAGLPLQRIRVSLSNLAELADEPAPLAELQVLTDGVRILMERSDDQLLDVVAGQFSLRLPIAELLDEVVDRNRQSIDEPVVSSSTQGRRERVR